MKKLISPLCTGALSVFLLIILFSFSPKLMAQCGNAALYQPMVSVPVLCSGATVRLSTPPLRVNQWIYRDSTTGAWTAIGGGSFNDHSHNVGTVGKNINREYRAVVSAAGCSSDTSKAAMVTILAPVYGIDNTVVPASSVGSVCSGASIGLSVVPLNFEVINWLYRDSSAGTWLPIGSSVASFNYNVGIVSTTVTRSVRALIRKYGQCRVDSSAIVSFTIQAISHGHIPNLVPKAGLSNNFFCGIGLGVDFSYNNSVDSWLYRNVGSSSWIVFSGANSAAVDTNISVSISREYRVLIKGSNCNIDSSAAVTMQIPTRTAGNNPLFKPSISATAVCSGSPVYLSAQIVYSGQTLGWLQRDNHSGAWVPVGTTLPIYTDLNTASVYVPVVRSYRVITKGFRKCHGDTSAEVSVQIKPMVYGNSTAVVPIISNTQVCEGTNLEVSVPSNAAVWKWVYRDNNSGSWLAFSGANSSLNLAAVANRALRVILLDSQNCRIDTSAQVSLNVKPYTYNGGRTLLTSPVSSAVSVCEGDVLNMSISPASPYTVHKWIFSDQGSGLWVNHPASGNTISNVFSLSTSTVRTYISLLKNQETCVIDSSAPANVQLIKRLYGNLNTVVPFSPISTVCSGTSIQQAINVPIGYTVQNWIYRDNNNANWLPMAGSNKGSITDALTVVASNTIRSYRALMLNESLCRLDTSAEATVSIRAKVAGNNSAVVPRLIGGGSTTMCTGSNVQLTISNPNFYSWSGWLYRDNDTGSWIPTGFPNNSYTDNQTHVLSPVKRSYRVLLTSPTACSIDTSGELAVQLLPYAAGRNTSDAPVPASPGAFCSGTSSVYLNYSTSNTVQRWIYSDNTGPWYEVSGSSNNGLVFDNNTIVGTNTTRTYRVIYLRAGTCLVDTSGAASIDYFMRQTGAVLLSPVVTKTSICAGSPATLSISLSPGQAILKWMYKDNNGAWMDVPGAVTTSLSDNNTKVSVNTTRLYKAIINNSLNCSYDSSLSASVMIKPIQYGNATSVIPTSSKSTVCKESFFTLSVSLVNPSSSILTWMYSDNQAPWININSNTNQIGHIILSEDTNSSRHFRVMIAYNGSCNIDSSGIVTVNVKGYSRGTNSESPVAPSTFCVEAAGMSNQVSINLNVFSGQYVVEGWLTRDGNAAWRKPNYDDGANILWDPMVNVSTNTIRSYRALIRNKTSCVIDSTAIVSTLIMPMTGSILNTAVPSISSSPICAGFPVQVTLNPPPGYAAQRWLYADTGSPWTLMKGSVATFTGIDSNTQVLNNIGRAYALVMRNASTCRQDTSVTVNVNIQALAASHGQLSTVAPVATPSSVCSGAAVSLFINNGNNKLMRWLYKDNQGPWHELPNTKASSLNHTVSQVNTGTLRQYKTLFVNSSACRIDSSASDTVQINPWVAGNNNLSIFGPDTVCTGTAAPVYYNLPTNASAVKWMYSDNLGPWQDLALSNLPNYSDSKTNTFTYISRRYRAIVFDQSSCSMDSTGIKTVIIQPRSGGNSAVKAFSQDSVCAEVKSVYLSIASGQVLSWIYRDNFSGPWQPIASSSSMSFIHSFPGFMGSRMREYRAIVLNASCGQDTTLADTTFISSRSKGNINSIVPASVSAFVCSGSSATITVNPGLGNTVLEWIYRNNNTGPWLTFAKGNINSITDYGTHTNVVMTRTYRAIIQRTCSEDTSAGFSLSFMPYGAGNSSKVPIASSSVCAGNGIALSMVLGTDSSVYKWIYRNGNNGPWLDLSFGVNSTIDNNTHVNVITQRQYRAILSILSSCSRDTTAIQIVTIFPLQPGNIAISPTATMTNTCSGAAVSVSASPNSVIGWVYSLNGSAWKVYPYAKGVSFTDYTTNYTITTVKAYRALIYNSSTCNVDTSQSASVIIQPPIHGNDNSYTFTGPATLCGASTDVITISSPGAGNSISHWIYSDNSSSSWQLLNQNSASITVSASVSSSTLRQYRAIIVKGATCHVDTSNAVNITITPPTYGNDTITPTASKNIVCYATPVTLSINTSSSALQGWIYRDNGTGPWLSIGAAGYSSITDNYAWINSSMSRSYRALILKSNCQVDTSAERMIQVNFPAYGNGTQLPWTNVASICNNTSMDVYSNITAANVKGWIYKVDSGFWQQVPGTMGVTYFRDYNTLYNSTVVKAYRLLVENVNSCSIDTSLRVSVTINYRSFGNVSIVPQAARLSICGGYPATLSISSGSISKWLYRDNHLGEWLEVAGSAGLNTLDDYNTNVTDSLQRTYRALLLNGAGCTFDTSAGTTIIIKPMSKGNSTITAQAGSGSVCSGAPITISINPGNSRIAGWITRDYANPWIPAGIGKDSIVNLSNTNRTVITTRSYRALLFDSLACSTDTSEAAMFTIRPIGPGSDSSLVPMALTPFICSGSIAQVNISGNVKAWVYRDTISNAWTVLPSQTGNTASNYILTSTAKKRNYRAIVLNDSTCTNDTTGVVTITINPVLRGLKNVQTMASSNLLCTGSPLELSISNYTGSVLYWLYRDNGSAWNVISNSNHDTIQANTLVTVFTTREYLALLDSACKRDSTLAVGVSIGLYPVIPKVNQSGDTLICLQSSGLSYQWKLNGTDIAGANDRKYIVTQSGIYTVEVSNATGCKNTSDPFSVLINTVKETLSGMHVELYPNPAKREVNLEIKGVYNSKLSYRLLNMMGQELRGQEILLKEGKASLNLEGLAAGVYILVLKADGQQSIKQLVISKNR